jgi:serine/threonine protein kinase
VAVKVLRQPDADENEDMALRLEKQFNREVAILSHLHHWNIVQVGFFFFYEKQY